MFSTIQQLQHHIRTAHGDSNGFFSGKDWDPPIHGVGQGNGAGPQIWALVSTPILNMLRNEGCGSFFVSPLTKTRVHFVGYAFVDDTDLVASTMEPSTASEIFTRIQHSLMAWEGGIRASGGAIVPEKCHWYMIDFQWHNGKASYVPKSKCSFQLQVQDTDRIQRIIKQLDYNEAERTLGVRIAPDGNMEAQALYMEEVARQWGEKIRVGTLSRKLTIQALLTTIERTLSYPLPATTLTEAQCHRITTPLRQFVLPKMGVARTFPTELCSSGYSQMGICLPNLFWLQGVAHLDRLVRYSSSLHLTGRLIRQSLEVMRMEVGCNGSLFQLPFRTFGKLATESWVQSTWYFVDKSSIVLKVHIPEIPVYAERDALLIPFFASHGLKDQLVQLNRCRIRLQVSRISDITTACGNFVSSWALNGEVDPSYPTDELWPRQGPPTAEDWLVWKRALGLLCSTGRKLRIPLGRWLPTKKFRYFLDNYAERLYEYTEGSWWFYSKVGVRPSRNATVKFLHRFPTSEVPPNLLPVSIEKQGQYLRISGVASTMTDIPGKEVDVRFGIYIPPSLLWVFHNVVIDSSLFDDVRSGDGRLTAVSDGSFKDGHGTASWVIECVGDRQSRLTGSMVVPAQSEVQSAYRSELGGLYAIAATIWVLSKRFNRRFQVEIGCDGLSAITMCSRQEDFINPNVSHFDLIGGARKLLREARANVTWRYVKGHQDASSDVLDYWASLNVQMDSQAKQYWTSTKDTDRRNRQVEVYGEPGIVMIGTEKVVLNFRERLLQHLSTQANIQYWAKRYNFGDNHPVDWKAISGALKGLSSTRQIWVTKHAAGFFGHGRMMYRWKKWTTPDCPRCKRVEEDPEHIILCSEPDNQILWEKTMGTVSAWLEEYPTHPQVKQGLLDRLHQWKEGRLLHLSASLDAQVAEAIRAQDEIGWFKGFLGFWSVHWRAIQEGYLQSIRSRLTPKKWIDSLIRLFWNIAWDFWELRNGYIHHAEVGRLVLVLNAQIEAEFAQGWEQLRADSKQLFQPGLLSVLGSSVENKKLWVARVHAARKIEEATESLSGVEGGPVGRSRRSVERGYKNERRFMFAWLNR